MEADAQTRATIVTGDEAQQVTPSKTETTNTFLTEHLLIMPTPLCREAARTLPEAMVAALDIYKCRTEGGCSEWPIEEDDQPLSNPYSSQKTGFCERLRPYRTSFPKKPWLEERTRLSRYFYLNIGEKLLQHNPTPTPV